MNIHPRIVGEFEDAALMTVVAADGLGFMLMATVVEKELSLYKLEIIGATKNVLTNFMPLAASAA